MATLVEVEARPSSGLNHIDALLAPGPGWNWLLPARTTLTYTFSLIAADLPANGAISGPLSSFNGAQQAAVVEALALVSEITGIGFAPTSDGELADLHFAAANLTDPRKTGLCSWQTEHSRVGVEITQYSAEAWIYLDNAEFAASNGVPAIGSVGFEVLLHEIGHALGLKHPFEGGVVLPTAQDNTSHTLMSYTDLGGPHATYSPYDLAALAFLYGGDGLGGARGHGSSGMVLLGSTAAETISGGAGNDVLQGGSGNDTLIGGGGLDVADYERLRADYVIAAGGVSVQAMIGGEGLDSLAGIERLRFADQALAFDLDKSAGTVARFLGAVFGREAVANTLYAGIGLSLLDGGMSANDLMAFALQASLGPDYTAAAEVALLYRNLTGVSAGADELAYWVGTLETKQYTAVSLALFAADLPLNAANIDLVGLAQSGLAYLPPG